MKPIISLAALLLLALFGQGAPNVSSLIRFTPNHFTGVASIVTDARGNVFICGVTQRPEELPRPMVRIGKPRAGGQDAFVT
jgi:hypothetical protein